MRAISEVIDVNDTLAHLLGLDLDDPETAALDSATERDMELIATLVQVRRDRGLTQQQVAERMSRSQPNVSAFERLGGDPHVSTIRRYAVAIGAEVHWRVAVAGAAPATIDFSPSTVGDRGRESFYGRAS